ALSRMTAIAELADYLLQSYRLLNIVFQSFLPITGLYLTIQIINSTQMAVALLELLMWTVLAILHSYSGYRIRHILASRADDVRFLHKRIIAAESMAARGARYFTEYKVEQATKINKSDSMFQDQLTNTFLEQEGIGKNDIDKLIGSLLGSTTLFFDKSILVGFSAVWITMALIVATWLAHLF